MVIETCRDIFDAVFLNVKESYIKSRHSSKVKSRTLSESLSEDENLSMSAVTSADPKTETNINSKDVSTTLSETVRESTERDDDDITVARISMELEEKFPYALGAACSDLAYLDELYREEKGMEAQGDFCKFYLDLPDAFPLCEEFGYPCVMFVSSMLLIDVDEERSDDFYERYASAVSKIASRLSYKCGSTVEKYPY